MKLVLVALVSFGLFVHYGVSPAEAGQTVMKVKRVVALLGTD